MGTSVWEQGPAWVAENFDSVNPATSEVIGTYPVQGRSEVDAVVERARQAASWWSGLTYSQRRGRLLAWKSHITRYLARLAELDPQQARIVELRYFGGLSVEETAEAMAISPRTVKRDWAMAKVWMKTQLESGGSQ